MGIVLKSFPQNTQKVPMIATPSGRCPSFEGPLSLRSGGKNGPQNAQMIPMLGKNWSAFSNAWKQAFQPLES